MSGHQQGLVRSFAVLAAVLAVGTALVLFLTSSASPLAGATTVEQLTLATDTRPASAPTEPAPSAPSSSSSSSSLRPAATLAPAVTLSAKPSAPSTRGSTAATQETPTGAPAAAQDPAAGADDDESSVASVTLTPYSFSLTSFNILGSQHTDPGGGAPGFAPGRMRAEWAARIVVDRGIDVVGWSELQPDQYAAMTRALGGRYSFWPGNALKYAGTPASVMWRNDRFSAVWKGTVTIPFLGQQRPMPVVQLRHLATGREFFVMNVHNAPGGHENERDRAEALELATIRSFRQESGLPFFLTGDFNEHGEIFCTVRSGSDLLAANGGSMNGGCQPPGGRPRLDWVFGSPDATFTGYLADKGATIQRITDHAVIFTTVAVH